MGLAFSGPTWPGQAFTAAWLPEAASRAAAAFDRPFGLMYALLAFAVVLVAGLALAYILLFRRTGEDQRAAAAGRPSYVLLAVWTAGAAVLAAFTVGSGLPGLLDRSVAPYGAYKIGVGADSTGIGFTYPGGHVADTLHAAVGVPVELTMTSPERTFGLSVPELRLSAVALPGHESRAWFEATRADTFTLRTGLAGGADRAGARTALVTLNEPDFQAWLLKVSDIFTGRTPAEAGELLYNRQGCKACHSLDGSRLVGPTFLNLYGHEFETREGATITADDAYIKESILTPNVSVIAGYEPVMTPYAGKLGDREIEAITAWLRTLSDRGGVEEAADPAADESTDEARDAGDEEESR